MYVYFADSGNMTGSSAVFEYSKDGSDWKKFDGLVYGPYKKIQLYTSIAIGI